MPKTTTAKRAAGKKTATKKTATKKAATKKAAAKKAAAKKKTTKKAASKTAASKKTKSKTAPSKKTATRKTAAKTTAKKTTAKKAASKTAGSKKTKSKTAPPRKTSTKKAAPAPAPVVTKPEQPFAERASWLVGPLAPLHALAEAVVDLGVLVVDEAESLAEGEAMRERYADGWSMGLLWSSELWEACRARVGPLRLWALGPGMTDALGLEIRPSIFIDPAQPDRLWYTPTDALPAALFVPLPATRAAIEQALGELGPAVPPVEPAEAVNVRAYMGVARFLRVPSPYSGELEPAGPHELDRHFNFSPVVTPHAWGSAYADDPLRGRAPVPMIQNVLALREMREQAEGALPRFTRRAYFSDARVAIEMHRRGHYVWDITYRPARLGAEVMAAFNALTGITYPLDLPLDVAAAVHGFGFCDAAWLDAQIASETDPGQRGALISAALAVAADDVVAAARIARAAIAGGLNDQVAVANAAMQYNWQFLLEELAASTASDELRAQIATVIADGLAPPRVNEHGEPADLYDSIPTGDDEEEADD